VSKGSDGVSEGGSSYLLDVSKGYRVNGRVMRWTSGVSE
jgi:hypothetical protein